MSLAQELNDLNNFVWGPIMLALLVGTGIFLTIRLKFLPWRNLFYAVGMIFQKKEQHEGDISPFQSLMTALSATVGTGNIVGVATAMVLGGPGALVWMWVSALFAVFSSFGIGNMTQAHSIASAIHTSFGVSTAVAGGIIMVCAFLILVHGIHSIGMVSSVIVPFMAVFYFIAAVIAILTNISAVPAGVAEIFRMAFSFDAVAGGVGGSIVASMLTAMRWGVARGVFSNEAGMGSAPIAAAAARTDHPSRQGYVNMTGTFFDTMIICMLTGLVIASSGVLGTTDPATGKLVSGANLTIMAFRSAFGDSAPIIVSVALSLFAFTTILGWEYYGEKALEYLVSARPAIMAYRILFSLITFVGATTTLEIVWNFSDTMNGLMSIPNLICLIWLSNDIAEECFGYEKDVIEREK